MTRKPKFNPTNSPMKDENGRWRTMSLFWELRRSEERADKYPPIFTTKDDDFTVDGVTYQSMKKIYLSYEHIPGYEYDFAINVLGSWDHWKKLSEESQLRNEISQWRSELEIKLRANAIRKLIQQTDGSDNKAQVAAKYFANKEYQGTGRGRPSTEEVTRERKIQAGIRENLEDDMERIGLSIIEGKKKYGNS